MQQTLDSNLQIATHASARVQGVSKRVLHLLTFVPEEKLAWTPSASARSPLNVVAHCAIASHFFARTMTGAVQDPMPSPQEFLESMNVAAAEITSRQAAIELLEENTRELVDTIESLTADSLESTRESPFGTLPIPFLLDIAGDHLVEHMGQLTYLQTIWGDMDNHFA